MIFSENRFPPIGSKSEGRLFPDHALVLEQLFQLDMDTLAERRMMTPTGGQERTRFFGGVGLDPPLLGARHQHRGVEDFRVRLQFELSDG